MVVLSPIKYRKCPRTWVQLQLLTILNTGPGSAVNDGATAHISKGPLSYTMWDGATAHIVSHR